MAEIRAMEDWSQALKPNPDSGVCPAGFQSYLRLMTPFYYLLPPDPLKLNVYDCYPVAVPPWVLGRQRQITGLFSLTAGMDLCSGVVLNGLHARALSTPDLDDLDEILDF